jgi:hypothetical protein
VTVAALRSEVQQRLTAFLWDQWAQMGVSAAPRRWDPWAADPEALLLLTFEVGRGEPRLFDEVLDWLVVNEGSVSVQRLRNLARDEADRALVDAVLGWLGEQRRRPRFGAKGESAEEPRPFFRDSELRTVEPDPAFLAQGFLRPSPKPSHGSQAPAPLRPINFAFRLRDLLGIGTRAEVVRILLTVDTPWVNVQAVAAMTAFTKRNVQEALKSLSTAGALDTHGLGNEQRFGVDRDRWRAFLELETLPIHLDWPQLFAAYRRLLRWLADPAHEGLSDYMLASEARTLVEEIGLDLRFAGVAVSEVGPLDASYPGRVVDELMRQSPV